MRCWTICFGTIKMSDWSDIQGHIQIKQDLRQLLAEKRLPHALLFTGMEGIGKKLTAQVLAKALFCGGENAPCGECVSCKAFAAGNHPDFYYLESEGKAKNIKIEQIRQMQSQIALSPYLADKRVVVIDGAEYMNEAAANSLLKTLEEPTGDVVFILVTANKDMLLPTILSRCMKIYFAPLGENEIVAIAKRQYNIEDAKARMIARLSGGSMSKALSFVDEESLKLNDSVWEFVFAAVTAEYIWRLSDELAAMDREKVMQWAGFLQMIVRDLLLIKAGADDSLLYNGNKKAELDDLAARFSIGRLLYCQELGENLALRLKSNADVKLMVQDFMLKWREPK